MPLCYFCGKEGETYSCPHCNIKFCAEHLPPEIHNCIAYSKTSKFDIPESVPEPVYNTSTPVADSKRLPPKKQITQSNKMMLAGALIVLSVVSVVLVMMFASGPEIIEGKGPATVDLELHAFVLGQVNVYRYRNDLPDLDYDPEVTAQAFAEEIARTGVLKHNPELSASVGENVAKRTERGMDSKAVIALMMQDMVINDEANGGVNRANILYDKYKTLSVGVSIEGDTVFLVLNFK